MNKTCIVHLSERRLTDRIETTNTKPIYKFEPKMEKLSFRSPKSIKQNLKMVSHTGKITHPASLQMNCIVFIHGTRKEK